MKCVICKQGRTHPGLTTVTIEREKTTIIIKEVPANICENCGEYFLNEDVLEVIEKLLDQAVQHGVEFEVLRYAA